MFRSYYGKYNFKTSKKNLRLPCSPRHSGRQTSSALLQTYIRLFGQPQLVFCQLKLLFSSVYPLKLLVIFITILLHVSTTIVYFSICKQLILNVINGQNGLLNSNLKNSWC